METLFGRTWTVQIVIERFDKSVRPNGVYEAEGKSFKNCLPSLGFSGFFSIHNHAISLVAGFAGLDLGMATVRMRMLLLPSSSNASIIRRFLHSPSHLSYPLVPSAPLPSSFLSLRPRPPTTLSSPQTFFASPILSLRFAPQSFQVRCGGSLKAKGKPRGPLWRQRKGVSKEALQVVFELKRCKGDKQKERVVLQNSASRLLKMDLLMVLEELRRQQECSLAKQVFDMVRKEEWYKPDVFLYREMMDTFGKNKLMEDVEEFYQQMQEEGLAPNAMILTEMMGAYIRNNNITRAYEIFEEIEQGGHQPEYVMYEILCRGLKKAGDFEKLKIVMEACERRFPDSPPPFSKMVMERGM